jgi:DNA-binding protein YbaB
VNQEPAGGLFRGDDELQAQVTQVSANHHERLADIQRRQRLAGQVTATAGSRNGMVSVEVGAQGQLLGLKLDPAVYERLSPQRLAAAVKELAKAATANAAGQVREIMAPVLPPGATSGDFTELMLQAPGIPDDEIPPTRPDRSWVNRER